MIPKQLLEINTISIMTKKNKSKIIIIAVSFILLTIFLFSKGVTSRKIVIGENEYSVYSKSYVYAELLCFFSFFDCGRAGVIYLYDEIEEKVLESVSTQDIDGMESVTLYTDKNILYFKSQSIAIKNNEWTLPRSLKKKSLGKRRTNNADDQVEKTCLKDKLNASEIYFASKRIHESFSEKDSITIAYITPFLRRDSIKVSITHAIEEDVETFYLKKNEKLAFFYNPELYNGQKTRQKSDYYNVNKNCYEFNNEGISHNSIYIKKLCYVRDEKRISLSEIYLLDGD